MPDSTPAIPSGEIPLRELYETLTQYRDSGHGDIVEIEVGRHV